MVDEGLAERIAKEPGFVSYIVVATGDDTVVSVTLFEDERGVARSQDITAQFVSERLQQFQLNLVSAMSGAIEVTRSGPG